MMKNYELEELLPIVANLAEIYTSKESTSVSYEVARQLMNAVLYCIREYEESTEKETSTAPLLMKEVSAKEAYQKGSKIVIDKVKRSKLCYEEIIKSFKFYRNIAYQDTIIKGMPAFFLRYDPTLNPQDHLLTLDYPTIGSIDSYSGVDAIDQYLRFTRLEQIFLNQFPEDYVIRLLNNFHDYHEELLINISSLVMRNAVGHLLSKIPFRKQGYTNSDYAAMKRLLHHRTGVEVDEMLSESIRAIVHQFVEDDTEMYAYFLKDVNEFSIQLRNAVEQDCLHTIFVI